MNDDLSSIMRNSELWVALSLAERTVRRKIEKKLKAQGLPDLHWFNALFVLANSPEGLRPFELEKHLLFEQPNISRLITRMIKKGYVVEFPFPGDKRGKILKITLSGDVIVREIWKVYGLEIDNLMGEIEEKCDRDAFFDALTLLLDKPQLDQILQRNSEA